MANEVKNEVRKEYIEREAFLKDLKLRHCKDCNNYNEVYCRACWVDDMFDEIEDAPAADVVEVVHSEWSEIPTKVNGVWARKCLHCNYSTCTCEKDFKPAFCSNCGAKMDGERKNNG